MANAETSDEQLIKSVAAGDRGALAELVDRHLQPALGVACRILGNLAAGEDLVHEMFLDIWTRPAAWRRRRPRFILRFFRALVQRIGPLPSPEPALTAPEISDAGDVATDELLVLLDRDTAARLFRAVAALRPEQRSVVAFAYGTGLNNVEAAEALGISERRFEGHLARARQELRRAASESAPSLEKFATMVDHYGTDAGDWPWLRRGRARRLLETSGEARSLFLRLRAIERALAELPHPRPSLRARIVGVAAAVSQGSPQRSS
jgi:RNA polymerase sigma-70 factor (ECF subfamily)